MAGAAEAHVDGLVIAVVLAAPAPAELPPFAVLVVPDVPHVSPVTALLS